MKKKIMTLVLTTAMTAAAGLTAFAGEWKSNDTGWWWLNDDRLQSRSRMEMAGRK